MDKSSIICSMNKQIDINLADNLPWDEIVAITKNDAFSEQLEKIPEETLVFATDPDNHDQLFRSALASLRKTNSRATFEEAEALVSQMQLFAQKIFKK